MKRIISLLLFCLILTVTSFATPVETGLLFLTPLNGLLKQIVSAMIQLRIQLMLG